MHTIVFRCWLIFITLLYLSGCAQKPIESPAMPDVINVSTPRQQAYPPHDLTGIYADSAAVRAFIQRMVKNHGFDVNYLNAIFSEARHIHYVVHLENKPQMHGTIGTHSAKPKIGSWARYRRKFLSEARIENGVRFWRENLATIQKASNTYAVDPEYLVAIIGVETFYGRNMGNTNTFDALSTLAFATQRRANFFATELENFILMAREEGLNPRKVNGSWAGAMGFGQFMPSSFRHLAVDFDRNGKRNLWQEVDAIGSVAHYFSHHGWQLHQQVAEQAWDADNADNFMLGGQNGYEYWLAYPNFKVIKQYNQSNKYAMAVHQLAKAIKLRYVLGERVSSKIDNNPEDLESQPELEP